MTRRVLTALIMILCATSPHWAADDGAGIGYRNIPFQTYTLPYTDGQARITVDWGAQGDSVKRNPQEVRDEYNNLVNFLKSKEVIDYLKKLQAEHEVKERELGKELADAYIKKYREADQQIETPTKQKQTTKTVANSSFLNAMPWEVRKNLIIGYADMNKESSVQWLRAIRSKHPEAMLFAVGWTSQKDLNLLLRDNPQLQLKMIPTIKAQGGRSADDWLKDYQVQALPALVHFPDESHMTIVEGVSK